MEATVLDHVNSVMRIYGEETFGPVVCVVRARGVDEAVRIANDTDYGLSAAVFGRDVTRALAVAKRIESGMCHINGTTAQDEPQMTFCGVTGSGYGRLGGKASVQEFTELRWISIRSGPGRGRHDRIPLIFAFRPAIQKAPHEPDVIEERSVSQ